MQIVWLCTCPVDFPRFATTIRVFQYEYVLYLLTLRKTDFWEAKRKGDYCFPISRGISTTLYNMKHEIQYFKVVTWSI